jgi:thiosulfate reductase cytochrome b subunit
MPRIYLHSLPIRIWHWVTALACVILFLTGVQLRYVGAVMVVPFKTAVIIHNWTGLFLIATFLLGIGFYLRTDGIAVFRAEMHPAKFIRDTIAQALYYGYGMFKGAPDPFHVSVEQKFNPLQAVTYQAVMLLVLPIQCITGLLLWNLVGFSGLVALLGGVRVVDSVHVLIFVFFGLFLPFHSYLGTLGRTPSQQYVEMITGYGEEEDPDVAQ